MDDAVSSELACFYVERLANGVTALAALAWKATPQKVAARADNHPDDAPTQEWLDAHLPRGFVWLEEIFADPSVRAARNLWNYRAMVERVVNGLSPTDDFVFRTINERLVAKTREAFPDRTRVLVRHRDVPDRRDLAHVALRVSA